MGAASGLDRPSFPSCCCFPLFPTLPSLAGCSFDSFPALDGKGSRKLSSIFQSPCDVPVSPLASAAQDTWKAKVMGRATSCWELRGGVGRWELNPPFLPAGGDVFEQRGGPGRAGMVTGRILCWSTSNVFFRMLWFPPTTWD